MKNVIFLLAMALGLSSCNAQEAKRKEDSDSALEKNEQAQVEPRGTWSVTKELDENGNLIRYDSTYTYSYGNINGRELKPGEIDSAMASFNKYIQQTMPNAFSPKMLDPFKNDSLGNRFFERGFFEDNWQDFFPDMQKQLKRMDSLHQQFFRQAQPGLFPPEERKKQADTSM